MSNVVLPNNHALELPAFGKAPAMKLGIEATRVAESRINEAKFVNPSTYSELEHTYNEGYRECKRHMATIGYQLAMANKVLEEAKADVILGSYAEFMKGKPKYQDNSHLRDAFIAKDQAYAAAYDRVHQLKAFESVFDGKIKVFENVCRAMRKQMDLVIRSGLSGQKYPTQG